VTQYTQETTYALLKFGLWTSLRNKAAADGSSRPNKGQGAGRDNKNGSHLPGELRAKRPDSSRLPTPFARIAPAVAIYLKTSPPPFFL